MEPIKNGPSVLTTLEGTVLDPSTRKATAFYTALGVSVWDAVKHGMNLYNGGALLVLAGVVASSIFGKRSNGN